jgi:CubicO group peptidase (beta-lactamase class C family)
LRAKSKALVSARWKISAQQSRSFRRGPAEADQNSVSAQQIRHRLDQPTKFDCGGACSFATVGDYIRFGQMLLNGGELDGQRILPQDGASHDRK